MQNEKSKIGLICDEGGDLPEEVVKKYQISTVPFKVDLGGMKDIPGNIYQKIRQAESRGLKCFIKTSQPSPGDFLSAFKKKLENFEKIICITITSKHSGTYNSACQAQNFLEKEQKEKLEIVDSLSGSGGEGLLTIKAASLIAENLQFKEIVENLKKTVLKTHLTFLLEDPSRLEASGRIPKFVAAWLKRMQKMGIRPLLGAKKGTIKPIGIKRGVKEIAGTLFHDFENRISKIKTEAKIKVAITHADNLQEVLKLKEMIEGLPNVEVVFINLIGNILGGLVGPGAVSLAWQE